MSLKDETEIQEMEVSNFVDDAGGSKEPEKPANAESSPAEDVSNTVADDTLSVVRDVVDKSRSAETAASSAKSEVPGQETGDQPKKEQDDENYSDVPFNKHPRFQQVLGRLKASELDAGRYRNVQTFIDQQGISAEEAAELLVIGGLMKTNPAEAWKRMQPTIQKVLIAAGEVLPDDLKEKVKTGEMSREAAFELSRSRASVQSSAAQRSFDQQRADAKQQSEMRAALVGAAESWETDRRARDPNFEAKLPAIKKEVVWLQSQEGVPRTPQGVQEQLRKAYEAVNAVAAPAPVPRPRPAITPVNGGQVNGDARPAPKTTLEIIQAEVSKRGAR